MPLHPNLTTVGRLAIKTLPSVMRSPTVSVIIVNWNGERFLRPLLDALDRQTLENDQWEVIMVDNASDDESVALVRSRYPWVQVIENPRNEGFAKGNNIGIRQSRGEFIALLNNDTIPEPDWLEELVDVAVQQQAGAVAPKLMFARQPGYINNAGSLIDGRSDWPVVEQGIHERDKGQYDSVQEISAFCGASVLINRRMIEDIGLFDEHFFMYFEDGDLAWRGQKAGWTYYLAPNAVVHHIHTGSSVEHSPLFTYYVSRNRVLILLKNGPLSVVLLSVIKVARDRLWSLARNLFQALRSGHGWTAVRTELGLIVKLGSSLIVLSPLMLLKRWRLLQEPRLQP